jgi:hypothetical protein
MVLFKSSTTLSLLSPEGSEEAPWKLSTSLPPAIFAMKVAFFLLLTFPAATAGFNSYLSGSLS